MKKKKITKLISIVFGILFALILIPLVVVNLVLIIKGTINTNEIPSIFNISPMIVQSDSMYPVINKGDLIFIEKTEISNAIESDIIAFYEDEVVVTHRVNEIEIVLGEVVITTKGDNNSSVDVNNVTSDNFIGIYKYRVSMLGDFAMFLQKPYGLILFIALPTIAYILFEVLRKNSELHKQIKENKLNPEDLIEENKKLKEELEKLKNENQ